MLKTAIGAAGLPLLDALIYVTKLDAAVPRVTIAASRGIVSAPVWNVAAHAPKYGFTSEISELFTYADQQRAVQGYQTSTATAGITQPAILADQGVRNVWYVAGQMWGGQNLIIRTGVRAAGWKDLEGKTIGVVPGTYTRILFLIAARTNGVNLNAVNIRNVSAGATAIEAVRRGELDGLALFSPVIDTLVVEGAAYYPKTLDIGTTPLGSANGGILANDHFLGDRDLATRFMRAYVDSLTEMETNEEAFVRVATQISGIRPEVARKAKQRIVFSHLVDLQAIRRAATYGVEFGFTRQDVAAQVERYVSLDVLERSTGKKSAELIGTPPSALRMIGR
jgi:ABC-type nitrate/sulfonate/bicarbonate transport system substrate-binding protein